MWKINKLVKAGKYVYAIVPDHPKATKNNYVYHHRILIENKIGRILFDDEVVHHKDGNGKNNSIENLQLMKLCEHSSLHLTKLANIVKFKCPSCKRTFFREKRKTFLIKGGVFTACSTSCRGKFSAKLQNNRNEKETIDAIKNNVIIEFKSPRSSAGLEQLFPKE